MEENEVKDGGPAQESVQQTKAPADEPRETDEKRPEPQFKNAKETLYDKIAIDVHTLDNIIKFLLVLIVAVIILGIVKSRMG